VNRMPLSKNVENFFGRKLNKSQSKQRTMLTARCVARAFDEITLNCQALLSGEPRVVQSTFRFCRSSCLAKNFRPATGIATALHAICIKSTVLRNVRYFLSPDRPDRSCVLRSNELSLHLALQLTHGRLYGIAVKEKNC